MAFRQLEYLVAVAREQHFARAAEKCYVSQPALSAAIAKLERELEAPLVNRGRAFEGLTPQGERLVGWARRMLAEYSALKSEVRATGSEMSGTLRLGATPSAASVTSLLVSEFCSAHPLAKVEIRSTLPTTTLYRRLRHFELDAAIVTDGASAGPDLNLVPLYDDRYVVISGKGMLSAPSSTLGWPDAAQLPLALPTSDMRARHAIDTAFAEHGISVTPQVETDSVAALLAQVGTGEWASIVPRTWLWAAGTIDVCAVDLVDPVLKLQFAVATNRAGRISPVARAFASTAQQLRLRRSGPTYGLSGVEDNRLIGKSPLDGSQSGATASIAS
jgi:DNA-binding transcriptional LysR family regulator